MANEFEFESLPFQEAVDFFRAKGLKAGFDYRDVWQAEHQRAFTVAKAMTVDLLQDIREVVDKAIEDGIAFEDFRANLEPILRARGWWGRQEMVDPLTGETRDVQLGSVNRLRIIYDTNLRTSYSEGRWRQVQAVKADRPFVEYVDPDPNPRPQHLDWSGTVVHVDDPWVAAHWPPLDYNCRCEMNTLSADDIDAEGLAISMPDTEYTDYVNPRDGQTYQVPVGVHPSFAYIPGKGVEAAAAQLEAKLDRADADIAAVVSAMPAPSPHSEVDRLWSASTISSDLKKLPSKLPKDDPIRALPPEDFSEIRSYTATRRASTMALAGGKRWTREGFGLWLRSISCPDTAGKYIVVSAGAIWERLSAGSQSAESSSSEASLVHRLSHGRRPSLVKRTLAAVSL